MQWHDVFGNNFSGIPKNLYIVSTLKALHLLVSEIDVYVGNGRHFVKWPSQCQIEWCDTFGNTFSEIYASQNLYIESKLKVLRLLISEIADILENGRTAAPGVICLGTIAKSTCFGIIYMCTKFHAFTTKCTIFL